MALSIFKSNFDFQEFGLTENQFIEICAKLEKGGNPVVLSKDKEITTLRGNKKNIKTISTISFERKIHDRAFAVRVENIVNGEEMGADFASLTYS